MNLDLQYDWFEVEQSLKAIANRGAVPGNCVSITHPRIVSYIKGIGSLSFVILLTTGLYHYELSVRVWGYTSTNCPITEIATLIGSLTVNRTAEFLKGQLSASWSDGEKRIRVSLKPLVPHSR